MKIFLLRVACKNMYICVCVEFFLTEETAVFVCVCFFINEFKLFIYYKNNKIYI